MKKNLTPAEEGNQAARADAMKPSEQFAQAIEKVIEARRILDEMARNCPRYMLGDVLHFTNRLGETLCSDGGEAGMLALLETMKKKGA